MVMMSVSSQRALLNTSQGQGFIVNLGLDNFAALNRALATSCSKMLL